MLTVAPGFSLNPALLHPIELPAAKIPRFSETDYTALLDNPGRWLMSLPQTPALEVEAQPLNDDINPLLREFFIAQAVLAFQVRAGSVQLVAALGRIVLVDYEPWQQPDPPVPLLTLTPLDDPVIRRYNRAIRQFLNPNENRNRTLMNLGGGAGLSRALQMVLQAAIGVFTRAEAFYFYTKLISLATGAYTQV